MKPDLRVSSDDHELLAFDRLINKNRNFSQYRNACCEIERRMRK